MSQVPQHDVYGDEPRRDVAAHIPPGASRVLDVGCGRGGFGGELRRALGAGAHLVGVEAVPTSAAAARAGGHYDAVHDGYFPDALPDGEAGFDQVYFNDVLEHVVDPWAMLRATRPLLSPGGVVIASIPSIQYVSIVKELVKGRWDYTDAGTLDRTHVRFFTRATMVDLLRDSGYVVDRVVPLNSIADAWRAGGGPVDRLKSVVGRRVLGDAQYLHFLLVAHVDEGAACTS